MKKIISTQKVPLKGFLVQSMKSSSKKIKGGKKTIKKLSMPVSFKKGEQNPIKLKKGNVGLALLKKAFKQK